MPFYAGTVAYTREVTFSELPQTEQFEFSLDENLQDISDIVEMQINGRSLGVRAWAPYRWSGDTSGLKQGKNRVTLRVTNTLARLFTGPETRSKERGSTKSKG